MKNLTIRAGTLTDDERKIINHHIVATIQMLEALPWPQAPDARCPSTPAATTSAWTARATRKGLTREQMSVQARCMGIADIFEALTAKDRPYKKGKTLSESLEILGRMQAERPHRPRPVRHLRAPTRCTGATPRVPRPRADRRRRRDADPGLSALSTVGPPIWR